MIKIDKENFKIETDCRTVGEFMTEAAAIFEGNVTVIVDGCCYEFHDNPKIRVIDDTPINFVHLDGIGSGGIGPDMVYIKVLTKPKPKTVKKSGWVNIYRATDDRSKRIVGTIYDTKAEANMLPISASRIAVAKIEWEEVEK